MHDTVRIELSSARGEEMADQLAKQLRSAGVEGVVRAEDDSSAAPGSRGGVDWAAAAILIPAIPVYLTLALDEARRWLAPRKGETLKISVGDISVEVPADADDAEWTRLQQKVADLQRLQRGDE